MSRNYRSLGGNLGEAAPGHAGVLDLGVWGSVHWILGFFPVGFGDLPLDFGSVP